MNYQTNVYPETIRQLLARLLTGCGDIDEQIRIKIVKRDEDNVVTKVAYIPIGYIDVHDNICIELSDVEQAKFTPYF